MEVIYNVKSCFKSNKVVTKEEIKEVLNKKLINIIISLEKQNKLTLN